MRYLLTAEQMKASDSAVIRQIGIPSLVLMERAALQCLAVMKEEKIPLEKPLIVCGSGNNGGDGFALARLLWEEGIRPEVVLVGNPDSRSQETRAQMEILEREGIEAGNTLPDGEYSVIIDAVFGVGLSRNVEGRYREVLERMNRYTGAKVAVDIPSGVSADTGQVLGCAFRADLTVTFAYGKIGQYLPPGSQYAGRTVVRPIGIRNRELEESRDVFYTLEREDLRLRMPKRRRDSHKGTYGRVLLAAGGYGMSGAAYLAARAAYRTGAGLVRIYTEESNRQILQQLLPEAILSTYSREGREYERDLPGLLAWADVVCLGCGLGQTETSRDLVRAVLGTNTRPCVIDADGLNILASLDEEERGELLRGGEKILTPHMMEMARLCGVGVDEVRGRRIPLLREFVERYRVICALKDSRTLVAAPDSAVYLNTSGNAAMAKGGSGDVLSGVIAGLLAQGAEPREAAVLGVYLHGLAGDHGRGAHGSYSLLAGELADGIGEVLRTLEEEQ